MKKKILTVVVALACVAASSANAQSLMQTIRDKWNDTSSGRTTTEKTEVAPGVADSWGAPNVEKPVRPLKEEQQRDARLSDERYRDESRHKEAAPAASPRPAARISALKSASKPTDNSDSVAVVAPAAPRTARVAHVREPVQVEREPQYATPALRSDAACLNVSRTWEGAAVLASRGQTDRAYSAYLKLFLTCTSDRELMGTAYEAQKNLEADQMEQLLNEPVLASPRMAKVVMVFTLQRMYAENKAKRFNTALSLSRSIRPTVLRSRDAGALEVSGWLEQRAGESGQAEALFRAAMAVDKRAGGPPEGLALSLLAQGKTDEAATLVAHLDSENANSLRAEVAVGQARDSLKRKDAKTALRLLDKAETLGRAPDDATVALMGWALRGTGDVEKAKTVFVALHDKNKDNEEYQLGLLETAADTHDYTIVKSLIDENGAATARAKTVLAQHYSEQGRYAQAARLGGTAREGNGTELEIAGGVRTKSGTPGEGMLTTNMAPEASVKLALGDQAKVELKSSSFTMDDGSKVVKAHKMSAQVTADLDDAAVTAKIGVVGVQKTAANPESKDRAIGELKFRQYTDDGYVQGRVAREEVMDSTRSFAGAKDVKGAAVGPASRTTAELSGKSEVSPGVNVQWNAAAGTVAATGTASNGFVEAGGSLTKDFKRQGYGWLNAGPEVRISRYKADQNNFTGANGGYYSPTSANDFGMTFNALTTEGRRFLTKATGRVGYTNRTFGYGTETGMFFEGDVGMAALLYPRLIVGTGITVRNAPGYTESGIRFWLSVPFEARKGLYTSDLKQAQ